MSERRFATRPALDSALASWIAEHLHAAVAARGVASLVVSGGSTPKGCFSELALAAIDWPAVTIIPADERWVPPHDSASNEAMIRENLLVHNAAKATFISLLADFPNRESNLKQLRATANQLPTFDLVILGMGLDGHTASLFPCSPQIKTGLATSDPLLMIEPTTAPHSRISLSRFRLRDTRLGLIHLTGAEKLAAYKRARRNADPEAAPIAAFTGGPAPFALWYAP